VLGQFAHEIRRKIHRSPSGREVKNESGTYPCALISRMVTSGIINKNLARPPEIQPGRSLMLAWTQPMRRPGLAPVPAPHDDQLRRQHGDPGRLCVFNADQHSLAVDTGLLSRTTASRPARRPPQTREELTNKLVHRGRRASYLSKISKNSSNVTMLSEGGSTSRSWSRGGVGLRFTESQPRKTNIPPRGNWPAARRGEYGCLPFGSDRPE
jgi:hypothetical protein